MNKANRLACNRTIALPLQHMQRITLKDIARRTGLSVMGVSMALRNHPRIGEETRKRVRAVADEMGYRRDPMLSGSPRPPSGTGIFTS